MSDSDRITELEDRVAELEWRLDELLGTSLVSPVQMPDRLFQIVNLLANRSPMAVTHSALFQVATPNPLDVMAPDQIVKVRVSHARKHIRPFGIEIENVFAVGYRMPPEHAEKWKEMVAKRNEGIAA